MNTAAAPDLLEALILLYDNLVEYQRLNNIGGYDNHDMQMARAAIAKALGSSYATEGQPHTDTGERGRTEVKGVTFRDLRDCYVRAYCLAMGAAHPNNMPYYDEAMKGENAVLCEQDIYSLKGEPDPIAVFQNFSCEVEKLMGIYPNVPKLVFMKKE